MRAPRPVPAGFLLFSAGHLSYFLLYPPGTAFSTFGDVFALAGIFLLVRLLPRPTACRTRSRLAFDLLAAIEAEGPVGVARLLLVANLRHAKLIELIATFDARAWVEALQNSERAPWRLTATGARA